MNEEKIKELLELRAICLDKKERYLKAREECENIASNLKNYNKELNTASEELHKSFNINGKGADKGELAEVANDYASISRDFSGKVALGIESEIKKIDNEIKAYDNEIANLRNLSR